MPDDDAFGDDEPLGPPLPPEDRLWRHPSEVAWARLDDPAPAPASGRPPRPWGLALGAGVTGAVLALSMVALAGGLGAPVAERAVDPVPTSAVVPALAMPQPAPAAGHSVVRVDAVAADGTTATSSGVVLRTDGTIVTTAGAVAGATRVSVVLADGRALPALVVGADVLTDVAVLAAGSGPDWRPAVLASAGELATGDDVVAVAASGSTAGTVRGIDRAARRGDVVLHGVIETDAAVGAAAAGGALCDAAGAVVGMTTVVDGAAYAVPAHVVTAVAEDLLQGGVRHAWLGIRGGDAEGGGVLVAAVDGPAAGAGIAPGDVIVAVAGAPVRTMSDLVLALRARAPGDALRVEVARAGATLALDVVLGERP